MSQRVIGRSIASVSIEIVSGVAMVVVGVVLQVTGPSMTPANVAITVTGGILTALGGVLLSWLASRLVADRQAADAEAAAKEDAASQVEAALADVDAKLSSLSRVIGQASSQIQQAVQTAKTSDDEDAALALIAQANRMIYGQVSEIAVIRKAQFDPAYLLDTASKLDGLAQKLSSETDEGKSSGRAAQLASVREELEEVREDLSNVQVPRWMFPCPNCQRTLGTPNNGQGVRVLVCPKCFSGILVDPQKKTLVLDPAFEKRDAVSPFRSGSRPKSACPKCKKGVNMPLRYADGFFGFCKTDKLILTVDDEQWSHIALTP